jgi:hypothetical protein
MTDSFVFRCSLNVLESCDGRHLYHTMIVYCVTTGHLLHSVVVCLASVSATIVILCLFTLLLFEVVYYCVGWFYWAVVSCFLLSYCFIFTLLMHVLTVSHLVPYYGIHVFFGYRIHPVTLYIVVICDPICACVYIDILSRGGRR